MKRYFILVIITIFIIACGGSTVKKDKSTYTTDTLSIIDLKPNTKPKAIAQSIVIDKNSNKTIILSGMDLEQNNLTYTITRKPSHGTYENNIYTPNINYTGNDSIDFIAYDGRLISNTSTISLLIVPTNTPVLCKSILKEDDIEVYSSTLIGDSDGNYQIINTKRRNVNFSRDDINEIVTDSLTGLMWQDNESIIKPWVTQTNFDLNEYNNTSGDTATTYCENLVLSGYEDWRLPTIEELFYIGDKGNEFGDALDIKFQYLSDYQNWSSTNYIYHDKSAWTLNYYSGINIISKKDEEYAVRCVRDSTINKNLTCLMWQDNADNLIMKKNWQESIKYCKNLSFAGFSDWRLPEVNELYSR